MELIRKTVLTHGGRVVHILTPSDNTYKIASGRSRDSFVIIWGNGSGFKFLTDCFSIAGQLGENELLNIPVKVYGDQEFNDMYEDFEFYSNLVCQNYCQTKLPPKDINKILHTKASSVAMISRFPDDVGEYSELWKTNRRLTVKILYKKMFIATNRDGFNSMAQGACDLAKYGDVYQAECLPHQHYDWDENTESSVGVTLYYWQNKVITHL